jgi:DNA polymerase-3 subunit beta
MKAKIETSRLEKILKKIEGVADKRASMAVLSMVLVEYKPTESYLHLLSTDLEIGFKGKIFAEIEGDETSFCVPARKFYEIVKNFPEDEIYLIKDDNRLIIRDAQERILYNLAITDSEEFPSLPDFIEENAVEVPGKVLAELISNTIFSTSKEESHFVLGGIYFEPIKEEGILRAVASDGHRLVKLDREIMGIENVNFNEGFIIGRKAAKQIEDIAEEELIVKLGYINNYVVIWTSNSVFFTRTIEGTYPDYRSVIPSHYENILKVDRKLIIDALKRVSLIIPERFKPVTFDLKPDEIILISQEVELGKAQVKLSAIYEGKPLKVNYNADYILDALEVMNSEEVEIKIGEERTPALITGTRDEGFLYLVMPMVL